MTDNEVTRYSEQLNKLGIDHKIVGHPDLRTPAEVQGFLGLTLADGLSTMIMKADDFFVAVIRRDDCRLDFGKIRKILGVKSLRMASAEEFVELTHLPLGAARVYNPGLKTLLDQRLFEKEYLTGGTGSFTCSFRYKADDLRKLPKAVVADVTESDIAVKDESFTLGKKKRVLSGIRATGRLHLGNYLGAVKGMLALQENPAYETLYTVVDLHTMTTPFDPKTLRATTLQVVLDYLACGLDPVKSAIFIQSDLADLHTQLMFYFSTVISVARMQHLPTFKDKVKQYPHNVNMALLNYPVLMAADILIYKASAVPVGIDQEPHLEIAREVARKMNEIYGMDFPEPTRFEIDPEYRYIPSLTGIGKMSKSVEGSFINLTDNLEVIKQKLADVPTNSGKGTIKINKFKGRLPTYEEIKVYMSEQNRESLGVAALMEFVEIFQVKKAREKYEEQYQSIGMTGIRYVDLKTELAEAIYKELKPIQEKRKGYESNPKKVEEILADGAARARKIAAETINEVKQKIGV